MLSPLREIDAVMQRHIDSGEIQGAVTVVARRGKVVHFKAHGLMDVERGRAMQEDAIFRMASSSKPVLGVAAMMMIEEGLLHPSDEVATYLPQLKDMHFFLPPAKESRRVVIHGLDAKAKGWDEPSRYVSASGGLSSTAADFLRFEQMLANGGTLLGKRLLNPESVATMSSNQVGELFQSKGKQSGWGVGYGVAVVLDPAAAKSGRGQGAFGWGGAFGTTTWTDPAQEITAVLMVQQGSERVLHDFEHIILAAIAD